MYPTLPIARYRRASRVSVLAGMTLLGIFGCEVEATAPDDASVFSDAVDIEFRIIGGTFASPGEYPWMVYIEIEDSPPCGGALIAPDWVLTAGHCVMHENGTPRDYGDFLLTFGEHRLSVADGPEQESGVDQIHLHDWFQTNTSPGTPANDVALLHLNDPPTLNQQVGIVKLARGGDVEGATPWLSGWGADELEEPEDLLKEAHRLVIDPDVCADFYANGPRIPHWNEICTSTVEGDPNPGAGCSGDSGSPYVVRRSNGCTQQIAVHSWASACVGAPMVHAHVAPHFDWIRGIVPSVARTSVYEAETMIHQVGGSLSGGWNIHSNGYVSFNHTFEGGEQELIARAKGQFAGGAWPTMEVTVGGEVVYTGSVSSSSWTNYTIDFTAPLGDAEVRVYFTNDYNQNGSDRNLHLDRVTVVHNDTCDPPAHYKCTTGVNLSSGSSECVTEICTDVDPYCCDTAWDSYCVAEVRTVCDSVVCPEAAGTCPHSLCETGDAMAGCDPEGCASLICYADNFCCNNFWDGQCVQQVETVCGLNCT